MGDKEKKAILKIRDGETHNLKVKEEDGKLNIYFSSICKKLLELNRLSHNYPTNNRNYTIVQKSYPLQINW